MIETAPAVLGDVAAPPKTMARTYRSPVVVVTQLSIGVTIAALAVLLGVFAVSSLFGVILAVVLAAGVLYGFAKALRVCLRLTHEGIDVVNVQRRYGVPWSDAEELRIHEGADPGVWDVILARRAGHAISVDALRGPNLAPKRHRTWAKAVVHEINEQIAARQAGSDLHVVSPSLSDG